MIRHLAVRMELSIVVKYTSEKFSRVLLIFTVFILIGVNVALVRISTSFGSLINEFVDNFCSD